MRFFTSKQKNQRKTLAALKAASRNGVKIDIVGAGSVRLSSENISDSKDIKCESKKAEALFI